MATSIDADESAIIAIFGKEVKNMWSCLDRFTKKTDENIKKVDERLDNLEFTAGDRYDGIKQLEKEKEKLKDSLTYLKSQSMRNNRIFCNIKEIQNEKPVENGKIVRDFMVDKLKLAQEFATLVDIERAHRMWSTHVGAGTNRGRNIVVKFTLYKEGKRSGARDLNLTAPRTISTNSSHRRLLLNVAVWSRR